MDKQQGSAPASDTAQLQQSSGTAAAPSAPAVDAAKVAADARAAERARVNAILGHEEAKGREKLAQHLASNTEMDAEAAIAVLKVSPKESAAPSNQFAEHMAKQGNAAVAAGAGDDPAKVTAPVAANVYKFRQECVVKSRKSAA